MENEEGLINCKLSVQIWLNLLIAKMLKNRLQEKEDCKIILLLSLWVNRQVKVTGLEEIKMAASCTW